MFFHIGDSVCVGDDALTVLARGRHCAHKGAQWLCLDEKNATVLQAQDNMVPLAPTFEFDGELMQQAVLFADRVGQKLVRYQLDLEMADKMEQSPAGTWTSASGVVWRWDLTTLSLWRDGVYFALRLMTAAGRWI
jgi:hypothetical protein